MSHPVLWSLDPHTAAKHRVLRSYVEAWIPVMAQQALSVAHVERPRLLLIDGFAGPGRYSAGEPGSPLIMLDVLLNHAAFPRLGGVNFMFLFIEHDARRVANLRREIAALGALPANVRITIEHGEFDETFGALLDSATDNGRVLVPTFAFIDPFGYSTASMTLAGRLLNFPRCEVLFFLPLSFVHRFVGRAGQESCCTFQNSASRPRGRRSVAAFTAPATGSTQCKLVRAMIASNVLLPGLQSSKTRNLDVKSASPSELGHPCVDLHASDLAASSSKRLGRDSGADPDVEHIRAGT